MFFLGVALYQQTTALFDHALFPMARNLMHLEAQKIEQRIPQKMGEILSSFFQISKENSPIKVLPKEEFLSRATQLEIPLLGISKRVFSQGSDSVSLEFQDISLAKLAELLSRQFSLTVDFQGNSEVNRHFSLTAKGVSLEAILARLNQIPGIKIEKKGQALVVQDAGAPGSETIRLSFINEKTSISNPDGRIKQRDWEVLEKFEKNPNFQAFVNLHGDANSASITISIEIPNRKDKFISEIIRLDIDYLKWFKQLLGSENVSPKKQ
ncbi:DUF4974 domain-containing protein, partial [bacterium]|nr:DUF4974 domain-containing protein [bacterium]